MESDSAQVHIECRIQPLVELQVRVVENVEFGDIYWRITNWLKESIGLFRVAVNLIMKARLSAKAFHMKISFVCI